MKENIKKLEERIKKDEARIDFLEKMVHNIERSLKTLTDTSFKTSKREIINREVQFMQKVYDKNGAIVIEINA